MATTTPHYHYQTTPRPQYSRQQAELPREAFVDGWHKQSWELTTRASSFESFELSEDQQTPSQCRSAHKQSKRSSKVTADGRGHKAKHSPSNLHNCCSNNHGVQRHAVAGQPRDRELGCRPGKNTHQGKQQHQYRQQPQQSDDQVKYKTEMCKNLRETGRCKFGSKCMFAHSEDELRQKTHINLHYRSKKCAAFFDEGFCPYGSRCQYLHTEDSYADIFTAYCDKLLVWTSRNPHLDLTAIMRKTHPFVSSLPVFESLVDEDN